MNCKKKETEYSVKSQNEKLQRNSRNFMLIGLVLALFIVYRVLEAQVAKAKIVIDTATISDEDFDYPLAKVFEVEPEVKKVVEQKPKVTQEQKVADSFEKFEKKENNSEEVPEIIEKPSENKSDDLKVSEITEIDEDEELSPEKIYLLIGLDEVPLYPGCDKGTREDKKACFEKKVRRHVNKKFNSGLGEELGLSEGKKRISVLFKIDKTGTATDIQVRAPHPRLKKEALRVINSLPQMIPGKQGGKPVQTQYTIPITFEVQ